VVETGSRSGLGVNILLFVPFTTSARGTLDITVDWTIPVDGIHVFVSANECTIDQVNGGTCTYLVESVPSTVKPRLLTVTGVAAGTYTLYIGNRGPSEESVSWQIGLTTGGTAGATAKAQGSSSARPSRWVDQMHR
jgi:hypothetical protein